MTARDKKPPATEPGDCPPASALPPEPMRFRPDPLLRDIVREIVDSYDVHGGINHLEGRNLPSKETVHAIIGDLEDLVFPGYFTATVNSLNVHYHVGAQCASVFERLSREIEKSLRHECREGSVCDRDEGRCVVEAREITLRFLKAIPAIRELLKADAEAHFAGDPAARSVQEILLSYPGLHAVAVFRLAHALWKEGVPLIPRMMTEYLHAKTGIDIHPGATIGPGLCIDHGTGVVIGETTEIGRNVKIYQGVTLGALSVRKEGVAPDGRKPVAKRHPTLGDGVTIYAGATLLGGQTVVGEGSVIGGNVWLTRPVAPYTTVMIEPPYLVYRTRREDGAIDTERELAAPYIPDWEI